MPNEVDVSILRPNWFWSETSQRNLLSLDAMMEIYYRSIGRGAQLLLNVPPDTTGLMPAEDVARAQQFGKEIQRRFGKSVAETSGSGESGHVAAACPISHRYIPDAGRLFLWRACAPIQD